MVAWALVVKLWMALFTEDAISNAVRQAAIASTKLTDV